MTDPGNEIHLMGTELGARATNSISIEFKIRWKFTVFWFKMCPADHNEILHTSRQSVVIGWMCCEQKYYKMSLNFDSYRNIVSGTGARIRLVRWEKILHWADSRFEPSQRETALLCNNDSHWLGASLESTLFTYLTPFLTGWLCFTIHVNVNHFLLQLKIIYLFTFQ